MEPPTDTTTVADDVRSHSKAPDAPCTSEVGLLFPSPNWFHPRVLTVSCDGWVIYGAMTRGLCVLQPVNGNFRIHVVTHAHGDRVSSLALSPDWPADRRVLSGAIDGVVRQWRLVEENGEVFVHPINSHNVHKLEKEEVISVSYCSNDCAITVGNFGVLVKWDLVANVTRTYKKPLKSMKPTCVGHSPNDSNIIAVGTKQGLLFVLDFHAKATILFKIRGHDDEITGLSWCPESQVSVSRIYKTPATERMNKIRQQKSDDSINEIPEKNQTESSSAPEINEESAGNHTSTNLDRTEEISVVAEDDMFDIYADHEHDEFGHKKYVPEDIIVPVERPKENIDFLAECLKLKRDITEGKNKQEQTMKYLVESLEKAEISKKLEGETTTTTENGAHAIPENSERESKAEMQNQEVENTTIETHSNLLVTVDKNGKTCVWSKSGKLVYKRDLLSMRGKPSSTPGAILWHRPDSLFAVDSRSNLLQTNPLVVGSANSAWSVCHSAHKRGVHALAGAGDMVWSAAQDRRLALYCTSRGRLERVFGTFGGFVYHISPCPYDATRMAVAAGDGNVRVCVLNDLADATSTDSIMSRAHADATCYWQNVQGRITVTAWNPARENMLAFGTAEGRVGLLDTSTVGGARVLGMPLRRGVYSLSWSQRGDLLYVCTVGELYAYRVTKQNTEVRQIKVEVEGRRWSPTEAVWTERGFVVGGRDGELAVLTASEPHEPLAADFTLQKMVQCIAWHPQSVTLEEESTARDWIAVAANENHFVVFEFCEKDGKFKLEEVAQLHGHRQPVVKLAWSPHRNGLVLSSSHDATVRVWRVARGGDSVCVSVFARHLYNALTAAWWPQPAAPDLVMSGGGDHTLRLWDYTRHPPQNATKTAPKGLKFAMAISENDVSKKTQPKQEVRDEAKEITTDQETVSARSSTRDSESEGEPEDAVAICYEDIKKPKLQKRCLLRLSHRQMSANSMRACRHLVRGRARANGAANGVAHTNGTANGVAHTNGTANGIEPADGGEGLQFLKLFGSLDELNELLDLEQTEHLSNERLDLWATLGVMRGRVEEVFRGAAERDALSPFLLSLAPMVSHRFWKDQMQAYVLQCEKRLNAEKQPPAQSETIDEANKQHGKVHLTFEERSSLSTRGVHRKLLLLLAQHRVSEAADTFAALGMYREAYVLARVRHMDELAADMHARWAQHVQHGGSRLFAALLFLTLGKFAEAAVNLGKMADGEALAIAAELAQITGQATFAESLMKKREDLESATLREQELLKTLPDRLALHLKMREKGSETAEEKSKKAEANSETDMSDAKSEKAEVNSETAKSNSEATCGVKSETTEANSQTMAEVKSETAEET